MEFGELRTMNAKQTERKCNIDCKGNGDHEIYLSVGSVLDVILTLCFVGNQGKITINYMCVLFYISLNMILSD